MPEKNEISETSNILGRSDVYNIVLSRKLKFKKQG